MKQPDLIPGVRDEERPMPTLAAPFALTAQIAQTAPVMTRLFEAAPPDTFGTGKRRLTRLRRTRRRR